MTADVTAKDRDDRRARLEALQTLFVRLLFCDETLERFRTEPAALAADFGLAPEALDDLPDPDGKQMRAERHGRKMGVLSELRRNFPNTYPLLEQAPGFTFERFLSSDAFFDPDCALPHPHGVGQGYENSSKFFFWARAALGLDRPGAHAQLRLMLCGDFASYLIGQYEREGFDWYRRFSSGVYWRETPGADLPLMYMTVERHFFRYTLPEQQAELQRMGAADLDALTPQPRQRRENIR